MARDLELFQAVVKRLTGSDRLEARVPTAILIFRDAKSYLAFGPPDTYGVFVARQRANFAAVNAGVEEIDPTSVLLHEYVHYVVQNNSAIAYPTWYDEGFAELMRGTRVTADSVELGVVLADRMTTLRSNPPMPLEEVLTVQSPLRLGPKGAAVYYAQAWLLVHYLRFGANAGFPDRSAELVRYLDLVNHGRPEAEACRDAFGIGFAELQAELARYLEQGTFVGEQLPRTDFPEPPQPVVRRLGPGEVAGELGALALQRGDALRAEQLFRTALASRPGDGRAHFGLAEALRSQEREDELDALCKRGLELGPGDALNQLDYALHVLYRARVPLKRAERAKLLGEARLHLRRAIELAPSLPEAHAQLGLSYLAYPGEDRSKAVPPLVKAQRLLASDVEINYLLARALLETGRLVEAKAYAGLARARARGRADLERIDELDQRIQQARAKN
jgi:tetratricopeptide (TPR) repeat protein